MSNKINIKKNQPKNRKENNFKWKTSEFYVIVRRRKNCVHLNSKKMHKYK